MYDLTPKPEKIIALLKGRTVASKDEKFDAFKLMHGVKASLSAYISGIAAELSAAFDAIVSCDTVFNVDTGMEEPSNEPNKEAKAAMARVHMLMDETGKAGHLMEMLVESSKAKGKVVDSPAVNKMLDMFMKK